MMVRLMVYIDTIASLITICANIPYNKDIGLYLKKKAVQNMSEWLNNHVINNFYENIGRIIDYA